MTTHELPDHVSFDPHFNPPYDPWDQRLCLVPDGDLFDAIKNESATVVTDTIETFTETGLKLSDGDIRFTIPVKVVEGADPLECSLLGVEHRDEDLVHD